ncbi:cystatin-like protein isoform X2 [Hoplias malabaricus]|uniref:cystatin-like protein isoform X2 n=1 Tax=Hoplias malabaricus TaxID=27720 RepID=UPI0034621AA2
MKTGLKLLLLSAVTLLVSSQWENYKDLPDSYKTHIDKALVAANKDFGGSDHVAYEQLLSSSTFRGSDYYVNVRLMGTTCKKDENKGYGHREECVTKRPKRPVIDCVVCNTRGGGGEVIDCAKIMEVKNREEIRSTCSIFYFTGRGHILSEEVSAQWRNYQDLPDSYKTHIDKALDVANTDFGGLHYVAYEKVLNERFTDSDYYVNVRLMVTTCTKDENKGYGHREECVTKKSEKASIDCVVCSTRDGELTHCSEDVRNKNMKGP